jgi:hypothetical protein
MRRGHSKDETSSSSIKAASAKLEFLPVQQVR